MPYLSASAVVIHYEEALHQVYAPLPFTFVAAVVILWFICVKPYYYYYYYYYFIAFAPIRHLAAWLVEWLGPWSYNRSQVRLRVVAHSGMQRPWQFVHTRTHTHTHTCL